MFTLTTSLHGSTGSPWHSNQTRRRNKRYPDWKGGGKIETLHKWIHRVASVVSLCICDSHSPSCLFFQISHATGPVVEDLFLYLVELGIFWQNVFLSLVYSLLPASIFSSALPAIPNWKEASLAAVFPCPVQCEAPPSLPLIPTASSPPSPAIARPGRNGRWSPGARDDLLRNTAPAPCSPLGNLVGEGFVSHLFCLVHPASPRSRAVCPCSTVFSLHSKPVPSLSVPEEPLAGGWLWVMSLTEGFRVTWRKAAAWKDTRGGWLVNWILDILALKCSWAIFLWEFLPDSLFL